MSQLLREDVEKTLKRGFLKPDDLFATTATKPATEARAIFATRSEVLDMIFALSPSIITAKDDEATETVAWLPETPDCLYHMVRATELRADACCISLCSLLSVMSSAGWTVV